MEFYIYVVDIRDRLTRQGVERNEGVKDSDRDEV
jgi:hypothetical protein